MSDPLRICDFLRDAPRPRPVTTAPPSLPLPLPKPLPPPPPPPHRPVPPCQPTSLSLISVAYQHLGFARIRDFLRDVTRLVTTAVNTNRLASASRNCCNFLSPACRNTATTPGSHALGVSTFYPASWLSAPPSPMCRCSHLARLTGVHRPPPTPPPPPQPNAMSPQGFIALCRWSPLPPQLPPALALAQPSSLANTQQSPTAPQGQDKPVRSQEHDHPALTAPAPPRLRLAKFRPRLSPL